MLDTLGMYLQYPFVRYATKILHIGSEIFFGTTAEYLESPPAKRFLAPEGGEGTC